MLSEEEMHACLENAKKNQEDERQLKALLVGT